AHLAVLAEPLVGHEVPPGTLPAVRLVLRQQLLATPQHRRLQEVEPLLLVPARPLHRTGWPEPDDQLPEPPYCRFDGLALAHLAPHTHLPRVLTADAMAVERALRARQLPRRGRWDTGPRKAMMPPGSGATLRYASRGYRGGRS